MYAQDQAKFSDLLKSYDELKNKHATISQDYQ